MLKKIFVAALIFATPITKAYDFYGIHFIASYKECDKAVINNPKELALMFHVAVLASGAYVLGTSSYKFEGNGLTLCYLLSESHASLHSYPEHNSVFVDLFTCGSSCDFRKFDEFMRKCLKPQDVESQVIERA